MSGCIPISGGYICGGTRGNPATRRILLCPTEGRRRRMVQVFGGAWYSDEITCLGCGDSWCDGERGERPFTPGWRARAIAEAKARYATAVPRAEYARLVTAEAQAAVSA